MVAVKQKFKPPGKSDTKDWKIVTLLIENGFTFDSAYNEIAKNVFLKGHYPKTISEAEEFIKLYKER